ncbi:MAG: glutamate--tRNA ligase [Candidatus Aenigmarchaeota archaeon]|nr:glutamate--tRNA ligase [Candidatus Aenigmarchaeota archaeon]
MEEDKLIRKYVLVNATEHSGVAQEKSVLGKLLADVPELRDKALQLMSQIQKVTEEINRLDINKQKRELERLGGYEPAVRIERKGLPELDIERKGFVVRFAPNPDGALHLGNARPAILSDEYAKKYKGKFILRFDDTDPKVKVPEKRFYAWIRDDLKWLKIKVHKEIRASKRLNIYYKYADLLVKKDAAYVCTCGSDEWKKMRDAGRSCPCRSAPNQMRRWKSMFKKYKEGEAVLRIKTDLDSKNPAVRDWPAMRIVDKPNHPFSKKHVWPLYNFASAIDDYLENVTHIFRGQEHSTNETKQRFLYQHMKWEYPSVITLGRFSLSDTVLSKSAIREGIERGIYSGWDDLRLGTLRSLRRRGFQPEAIRQIIVDVGPKPSDITISSENLAAYNRKIIDKNANRYFFVQNPTRVEVRGLKIKAARIPLHPDHKRGYRSFSLSKTFFVNSDDFDRYKGLEVRLKDLCNVKMGKTAVFSGFGLRSIPKIQWLPAKYLALRIFMQGRELKGYGDINMRKEKVGNIVQLERFGFVRIENISKNNIIAVFGHE